MYKVKNSLGMTVEEFSCRKSARYWLDRWKHFYGENCTIVKSSTNNSKAK